MRHGEAHPSPSTPNQDPSNGEKPRLKERAKAKAKRVLNLNISSGDSLPKTQYEAAYRELNESPAFNSAEFLNKARIGPSGIPDKAIAFARGTAEALLHPKTAAKRHATKKAAGKLARSRPDLSRKADLDFLEAHDALNLAKGAHDGDGDVHGDDVEKRTRNINHCEDCIEETDTRRQSMMVAWVTTRHVERVRAIDALQAPPFPDESFFEKVDDYGYAEFQWGKWLGYKLLHITHGFTAQYIDDFVDLPFDSEVLRRHVERLIIVSAPLQTFISDMRRIYRWENPIRTARWMALYFFFWYISHVMSFFYGYIIYSTVMDYYYPRSLKDLRAGVERSIDRGATAFKVGEMMDKHGSSDWLGPLMEELGPNIQVQVADFANLLESYYNFYHFRNPYATLCSLCLAAALFLVSALGGTEFAMKVWWLLVGSTFFICFPISSRAPRYRNLVAPWKWTVWDVPTHAEWCFQYLQQRASVAKDAILLAAENDNHYIRTDTAEIPIASDDTNDSDSSDADSFVSADSYILGQERDILSFGCTYLHTPGRLVLSTTALRFEPSMGKFLSQVEFNKPYIELAEMSKRQTHASVLKPLAKVTMGLDKLELLFRGEGGGGADVHDTGLDENAEPVVLENMRRRDKAFNAIIGFSGLRWQNLQGKRTMTKSVALDRAMGFE